MLTGKPELNSPRLYGRITGLSLAAFFLLSTSVTGFGQTRYWSPVLSSSGQYLWDYPGNWETYGGFELYPGPPGPDDWAYIYGQHSTPIGISGNRTVKGLWLGSYNYLGSYPSADATATFNMNGNTLTATDGIYLGRTSSTAGNRGASLTVVNGTLATGGHVYADHSSVTTVQNGGRLTASGWYWSGRQGLHNQTPARLLVKANGIATFTGIDAYEPGGGWVEVTGGGVINSGNATFGSNTTIHNQSFSGVLVDGSTSRWNSTGYIALYGDVTSQSYSDLIIRNGGTVSTTDQIYTSSKGRVLLQGGLLETRYVNMSYDTLAHTGGTLRLTGAGASSAVLYPGRFYIGSSTLNLGGAGIPIVELRNNAYDFDLEGINVGHSAGQGRLYIYSGSDLTTTTGNIGQTSNTSGVGIVELSGAGSTWTNSGTILVGNSTTAGTLNVYTDSTLTTGTLTSSALGTVEVYGGNLYAATWNNSRNQTQTGGLIDVGRLTGSATITTSGTMKIGDSTNWNLTSTLTGTGTSIKEGSGTVTLTTGSISTTSLRIDAGNLQLGTGNHLGDSTNLVLNGGILTLTNGNTEKVGSLAGSSGVNLNGGNLEVGNNNSSTTYSGSVTGSGQFRKIGTGILTLSGSSNHTGSVQINGGTVMLSGGANRLSTTADLQMNGGILNLNNQNQEIGALSGTSNILLGSGRLTSSSSVNTTFAGVLSGTGGLTKSGSGQLLLSSNQDFEGATQVLGGTLRIHGTMASNLVEVSGGTLFNNGTINGVTTVAGTGLVKGYGYFANTLRIESGGVLAPGGSTGILAGTNVEFGSGGGFEFEISAATGSIGADWDGLQLSGTLDITANAGSPFELSVSSMGNLVNNFDSNLDYQWTFLTAAGGIQNFSADKFTINSTGFLNDLNGGSFSVSQNGSSLVLGFSAVPEPSALVLVGGVLAGVLLRRRRSGAMDRQYFATV